MTLVGRFFDELDGRLHPWAVWADCHGIPELFWGFTDFAYHIRRPKTLWLNFREYWFDPQQEAIDYIDGYCVGYYDTPSRFMWGVYAVRSWVDPRYWYWRATGMLPWPRWFYRLRNRVRPAKPQNRRSEAQP